MVFRSRMLAAPKGDSCDCAFDVGVEYDPTPCTGRQDLGVASGVARVSQILVEASLSLDRGPDRALIYLAYEVSPASRSATPASRCTMLTRWRTSSSHPPRWWARFAMLAAALATTESPDTTAIATPGASTPRTTSSSATRTGWPARIAHTNNSSRRSCSSGTSRCHDATTRLFRGGLYDNPSNAMRSRSTCPPASFASASAREMSRSSRRASATSCSATSRLLDAAP